MNNYLTLKNFLSLKTFLAFLTLKNFNRKKFLTQKILTLKNSYFEKFIYY